MTPEELEAIGKALQVLGRRYGSEPLEHLRAQPGADPQDADLGRDLKALAGIMKGDGKSGWWNSRERQKDLRQSLTSRSPEDRKKLLSIEEGISERAARRA